MIEVIARAERDALGEGPWWSVREQALYWVDITGRAIHRRDEATGAMASWAMPEMTGWLIERKHASGFIAGVESGVVALAFDGSAAVVTPFVTLTDQAPGRRCNDAKADRQGRLWLGTMAIAADQPTGTLHRLDAGGQATLMDGGYTVPNGPAISADATTLYHADSPRGLVYRFEITPDGALCGKAVHIAFEPDWGKPDGMTIDAEGCLWICHWGGGRVSRFDRDGRLIRSIPLAASQVTNCTFGGGAFDRLYVTSAARNRPDEPLAGSLFVLDVGVAGTPPCRFAG